MLRALMPKTTVNENRMLCCWKHEIWPNDYCAALVRTPDDAVPAPSANTTASKNFCQRHFCASITSSADPTHHLRTLFLAEYVHSSIQGVRHIEHACKEAMLTFFGRANDHRTVQTVVNRLA